MKISSLIHFCESGIFLITTPIPWFLSIIVTGRIRELPYSYRVRSVTKKANAGEEKILSGGNAIY